MYITSWEMKYLHREYDLNPYTRNNPPNSDCCVDASILFRNNNTFIDRQPAPIFWDFL